MDYGVGDRVQYTQVKHTVPLQCSNQELALHEDPKTGRGVIQFVTRVGSEVRVFVLPDEDIGKRDQVTLLLRVPPDKIARA